MDHHSSAMPTPLRSEGQVIYRPIVEDQARLTEFLTGTLDLIVACRTSWGS